MILKSIIERNLIDEKENMEFTMALDIARLIHRLVSDRYEEALEIYLETLQDEEVKKVIIESKEKYLQQENDDEDYAYERLVEVVIMAYMDTANILAYKKGDIEMGIDYIKKSIQILDSINVRLFYTSKAEVYFTYWKMLEKSQKDHPYEYLYDEIGKCLR